MGDQGVDEDSQPVQDGPIDNGTQTDHCVVADCEVQMHIKEATAKTVFVPTTPITPVICYLPVESKVAIESTNRVLSTELLRPTIMEGISPSCDLALYLLTSPEMVDDQTLHI